MNTCRFAAICTISKITSMLKEYVYITHIPTDSNFFAKKKMAKKNVIPFLFLYHSLFYKLCVQRIGQFMTWLCFATVEP